MPATKIKVLHIIKSLGRGGAEMLLPETLKLHNKDEFDFHYIYFLPWKNQLVGAIEQAGGKVTCFSASNNIQIIGQLSKVLQYIKANQIDMLHCHLPWAGFLGRFIFKVSHIPVIYTEHNKQERYHKITFWLNRLTFNWQTKVIAVSQDVAASINKYIAPSIPVKVVLNGVNTDVFVKDTAAGQLIRNDLRIPTDALVIGTVSVFRAQKRLENWLEVMAEACKHNPDVYGIIVGDGPLKNNIINKLTLLNLEKKVFMAGLQTNVKPWLSAIDIYMMSSLFEGLPIALLEAMSMSCAIASTDAGGIKELIRHEYDGLLVDVANWKDLAGFIEQYKNTAYRTKMADNARTRVVTSFSMYKMVDQLEDIYIALK